MLFPDIHPGKYTGFDLLDMLPQKECGVIFITAHEDFALRAFEYAAIDYLMKPISHKQLMESVHRVQQKKKQKEETNALYRHLSGQIRPWRPPSLHCRICIKRILYPRRKLCI